ncbi:hypothetical protein ACH4E7_43470 [Kitasatospora sp. NPDC018058]|uniref:hypothetical protein n=1 Tax=Kitasatospora sp. NPDC018058 TaxID=3364025 RepID=UPI0037C05DE1
MTTPSARRPLYRRPDSDPAQPSAPAAPVGLRLLAVELAAASDPDPVPVPPVQAPPAGPGRRPLADPGSR